MVKHTVMQDHDSRVALRDRMDMNVEGKMIAHVVDDHLALLEKLEV